VAGSPSSLGSVLGSTLPLAAFERRSCFAPLDFLRFESPPSSRPLPSSQVESPLPRPRGPKRAETTRRGRSQHHRRRAPHRPFPPRPRRRRVPAPRSRKRRKPNVAHAAAISAWRWGAKRPRRPFWISKGSRKSSLTRSKKGLTLVVFSRGGFCPFFNMQLHELAGAKEELAVVDMLALPPTKRTKEGDLSRYRTTQRNATQPGPRVRVPETRDAPTERRGRGQSATVEGPRAARALAD
jgi:hypothetical protein